MQPFRPFMIETIGRKEILISRSDAVLLPARRPELVIAFTDDGNMHIWSKTKRLPALREDKLIIALLGCPRHGEPTIHLL